MKLVDFIPPQIKIGIALAFAAALIGAGIWIHVSAYNKGWNAHVVVAEAEKQAIRKANETAIKNAQDALIGRLVSLRKTNERLESEVSKLDQEGDADPAGSIGGISADSVRRIKAIR